MKIIRLEPSIYNLISAGEVVECPASVVKELVENSIDAGATKISVDILGGGIQSISIIDNGTGIAREDVGTAFLSHATSKVKSANDLEAIATLGFRGEALPSIAAVSRIRMVTKFKNEEIGTEIIINGGTVQKICDVSRLDGTSITVEGLFFNTPARSKFLKSERAERSNVSELIRKMIIANPQISWKFSAEGKLIYASQSGKLFDAIVAIYGLDFATALMSINYEKDGYVLRGYIGGARVSRPSRAFQVAIINGRVVKEDTLGVAVQKGYGNLLMTRTYPVFILELMTPLDEIDINVHPAKNEVRFRDRATVFSMVYRAVNEALFSNDNYLEGERFVFNDHTESASVKQANFSDVINAVSKMHLENETNYDAIELQDGIADENTVSQYEEQCEPYTLLDIDVGLGTEKPLGDNIQNAASQTQAINILGQLFSTYLVIEYGDNCFIIDQHAAQEKLYFDKLLEQFKKREINSQPLIVPYVFELSAREHEKILSELENLANIGFDIGDFGDLSIKISAVPATLPNINIETFVHMLLNACDSLSDIGTGEIFNDKIAEIACKSAIKSGDILDKNAIGMLIADFDPKNPPLTCPHGRPAIKILSKRDLEKMFKRVL